MGVVKVDGSWKEIEDIKKKSNGMYKDISKVLVKIDGTWTVVWESF